MRGSVAVQRDRPRRSMLSRRTGKEPLGGSYITPFAQKKINGSTRPRATGNPIGPLPLM
jgi:hypothetical protein